MLPPPTTTASCTPRRWTAATCAAIAWTRSGSVPKSRSPMRASPDSLSRTRENAGSGWAPSAIGCGLLLADGEAREAADPDVLAGLRGELVLELLDRLALVPVAVDVGLLEQHDLRQPLAQLPLDDARADVLGLVG